MKRIGIYGGSFNPIHIGHLALANYICEYENVDEVWFMVTPSNPWKNDDELLPDKLRLKMVSLSVKDYLHFQASDFEFHLSHPLYTINTLHELQKVYPDYQFSLIIGADNWIRFNEWKDNDLLISNYELYIYPRPGYPIDLKQILPANIHLVNAPMIDLSASFIRQGIKEGHDLRCFVHSKIWKLLVRYLSKE